MNNLPKEILYLVNTYLDVSDRLCCAQVCRYWHDVFSNALRDTLLLEGPDNFDKVFMTFQDRKTLGFQISNLNIQECCLDEFTMLSLPNLFPRLKSLVWNTSCRFDSSYGGGTLVRQFKKWQNLENIDITVAKSFDLSCSLPLFSKLNCLTLTYWNSSNFNTYSEIDPLVPRLKCIATLTSLSLGNFMVDIDILERIHKEAKNLHTLILDKMIISRKSDTHIHLAEDGNSTIVDKNEKRITIQPVSCLKVFKLVSQKPEINIASSNHVARKISNLIQYVSIKYTNLSSITMDIFNLNTITSRVTRVPLEFEQDISALISKMNCLNHFSIRLEPLSDGIRKAITENDNIKLESIELWIYPGVVNIDTQLNNLTCRDFSDSLRFLKINDGTVNFHPNFSYASAMISYFVQLKNLTTLELNTTAVCGNDYSLLINILKHMPNLDKLSIKKFTCDPIKDSTIDMETLVNSKIRHLDLGPVIHRKGVRSFLNSILRFCIQSCPYLITFEISGRLKCNWGNLNLDFRSNRYVQSVKVNIEGCLFYTFNELSFNPKCIVPYRKYGVPLMIPGSLEFDFYSRAPSSYKDNFFINVLWNHHISLHLSDMGDIH